MRKYALLLFFAASTFATVAGQPSEISMTKQTLLDKIKGCWAGKVIGCTYGGPTEFKYPGTKIKDYTPIRYDKGCVKWNYENHPGLYDDVYMDLTFVDVFERLGLDAPVDSFAMAFATAGYPLWAANQTARHNLLVRKLMPPASGYWKNNPHADDIDFQIEADYAGLMAPGMVNTATRYTDAIGHIMAYGDGWYGGVYIASMISLAFVSNDIEYVVTEALKTIPEQSNYYKCMRAVIDAYKSDPTNWKVAWRVVDEEYSETIGCPDNIFKVASIASVVNSAYVVIGLLYGNGDFGKTIDIATRCGDDSDCNPSSAAGILGAMIGYKNIPEEWACNVEEVLDHNFAYTDISLNKATQMSFNQACKVIALNGGKVKKNDVVIKVQRPETVRFEESFTGCVPYDYIDCGAKAKSLLDLGELEFTGTGFISKGLISCGVKDYVASVNVYIDGKLVDTMLLPADKRLMRMELYYKYDLPRGKHTLRYEWTNPIKEANISPWWMILYK